MIRNFQKHYNNTAVVDGRGGSLSLGFVRQGYKNVYSKAGPIGVPLPITMINDNFGKTLSGAEVKALVTVGDILAHME